MKVVDWIWDGATDGMTTSIGGLGGFVLPITYGFMNDVIGVWTSCFMLLTVLIGIALGWMHFSILSLDKKRNPELRGPQHLPELAHMDEN